MRHGIGTELFASGAFFDGKFAYGLRSGYGTFTYADGSKIQGTWQGKICLGFAIKTNFNQNATSEGVDRIGPKITIKNDART